MKTTTAIPFVLTLAACAFAPQLAASSVTYHVDVDTSALVGSPDIFGIDFQLVDGENPNNASAVISNFNFGGGHPDGVGQPFGNASGDLYSTIHLSDSDFFNELFQNFTFGNSFSFDVLVASAETGSTPDSFIFAIQTVGNFFDVFVQIEASNSEQILTINSPLNGVSVAVSTPDSGSMAMFPLAVAGLGLARFFSKKGPSNS